MPFVVLVEGGGAGALALAQPGSQGLQPGEFRLGVLVAGLSGLGLAGDAVLHHLQVGEDQFHIDGVDVALRVHAHGDIDVVHHVDDVVVVKAAHHMDDGVALADVAQELVAQARALGRAAHQAGNVHEFDDGVGFLVRLPDLTQLVQPLVRHGDDARVGLDGAEGIVGGLGVFGVGDGVEQRALAHVGQTHDSEFHLYILLCR